MALTLTIRKRKVNPSYYAGVNTLYQYNRVDNSQPGEVNVKIHNEKGIISPSANLVEILFIESFLTPPIEIKMEVYIMVPYGSGYKRKDILWVYLDANQPRLDGVDIVIDARVTDLTGIIVEYKYEENV